MPDQATQDVAIIRLLLQSPQRHEPFSLKVSADARLVDVQRAISEQYDGHPHPSTQTVSTRSIFALATRVAAWLCMLCVQHLLIAQHAVHPLLVRVTPRAV